jgi:hypothetical protein
MRMDSLQHDGPHSRLRPHRWLGPLAIVVAVVVLTATLSWLSLGWERSPGPPDGGTPEAEPGTSQADPSDTASLQAVVDSAAQECRSAWAAQAAPLNTAATALAQWQVHVDAMNQLAAGEITLAEATAFWEQSRIEAAENVAAFSSADVQYVAADPSCRAPLVADDTAAVEELMACEDAVEARDEVLDAARVSIRTWHHHIIDMDLLRAGELSPEVALELWRRYWKQGVEELAAYREQLGETALMSCEGV